MVFLKRILRSLVLTGLLGLHTGQIVDYVSAEVVSVNIDMLNVALGRVTILGSVLEPRF